MLDSPVTSGSEKRASDGCTAQSVGHDASFLSPSKPHGTWQSSHVPNFVRIHEGALKDELFSMVLEMLVP